MGHHHEHDDHRGPGHLATPEEADARYTSDEQVWSGNPNQALVSYLGGEPARGTALDIGCGEGADLIWLAQQGWRATGIDFAPTAVRRARELVDASLTAPERPEVIEVSFTEFAIESGRQFDLVTCSYGQIPANETSMAQLENLVAPGGILFITHHDLESESVALPRWIADHLSDEFTVTVVENFERDVRSGAGAHYKDDVVLRAEKKQAS